MEWFLGTPDAHLQLNFGRWKKTSTWQDCRMKIRNWMRDCRQMTEIPLHWLSSHQVSYCSVSFDVVFLTGSRTANWTELWSKFLITRFGMRWIYFRYDKVLRVLNKRKSHLYWSVLCLPKTILFSISPDHFQMNRSMRIAIWLLEDIQILSVSLHRSSCSCNWWLSPPWSHGVGACTCVGYNPWWRCCYN